MNAAQVVVASKGYDQARMDDIVEKAQLSKGAIYWYYKSKKDIYLSLIDYWFNEYSAGVLKSLEDKDSSSEQLKSLFEYFVDQFDKNPDTFKIMVEFWRTSGLDVDFNNKLQEIYSQFLEFIIDSAAAAKVSSPTLTGFFFITFFIMIFSKLLYF